jgi:hypothetical protein
VLPQPSAHRFPPTWSLEGFNLRCKIWDWWWCDSHSEILAMWAGQGKVLVGLTHTCSSLAQGHRSGWRLRKWAVESNHHSS